MCSDYTSTFKKEAADKNLWKECKVYLYRHHVGSFYNKILDNVKAEADYSTDYISALSHTLHLQTSTGIKTYHCFLGIL